MIIDKYDSGAKPPPIKMKEPFKNPPPGPYNKNPYKYKKEIHDRKDPGFPSAFVKEYNKAHPTNPLATIVDRKNINI